GVEVLGPVLDDSTPNHEGADDRENRFGCLFPWQSLTVRANGDVEVCAYSRKITGNLETMSMDEIWHGKEQRRFRAGETTRNAGTNYCEICYYKCFRANHLKRSCAFPYDIGLYGY